ncbi:MAG TPA: PHP domain-containing protein, partial [Gemmatimonadales bacterium]|nr:PHP domain-containing protein [Gemmatimonadales bacterium]
MTRYAELHCHTNFSFLDGASHPYQLVERAAALGYEALAITDHNGFYGAARFRAAAEAIGMPTVYGVEVGMPFGVPPPRPRPPAPGASPVAPVSRRGRIRRSHGAKPTDLPPTDHLVLLAPDPAGYSALSRLVTRAQFRGEKDHPVYDYGDLAEASRLGRLVALTGCRQGAAARAALEGDREAALRAVLRLRDLFPGRLYVELWHHGMPEDDPRNGLLAEVADLARIPTVATNNAHYHVPSQADLAEVLAAVGGRRDLDTGYGFSPATDLRCLRSPEEMAGRFARYPGSVARAADLGAALAFDLRLVAPRLPDFPMPGTFTTEAEYLRHLTLEGARIAYPGEIRGGIDPAALRRIEHELGIIEDLGFPGYFLVV